MANIPAVFLGPTTAGDIKLSDLLRGYEAGLGRLGQGGGGVTTQALGEGSSGGGVTTLMYPHD